MQISCSKDTYYKALIAPVLLFVGSTLPTYGDTAGTVYMITLLAGAFCFYYYMEENGSKSFLIASLFAIFALSTYDSIIAFAQSGATFQNIGGRSTPGAPDEGYVTSYDMSLGLEIIIQHYISGALLAFAIVVPSTKILHISKNTKL